MKIVKRDGRTVDYDANKIRKAIEKANENVVYDDRISQSDVNDIIKYIESLNKKRMLVEDIQDIIELKLMEYKKYELAKIYIIYRYKRSVIRQSNTTDATILGIIKNNTNKEKQILTASMQRDLIAGETNKDLAKRILLPKNVVEAINDKIIVVNDLEHFAEPTIQDVFINMKDIYQNGTIINNVKIESPKSFQSACNILVEIICSVLPSVTGNIFIDLNTLFEYYFLSYEKQLNLYNTILKNNLDTKQIQAIAKTQTFREINAGIQTIFYQLNTLAENAKIYFLINTDDIQNEEEENIIFEFIRQRKIGINQENKNYINNEYPKIIYSINENNFEKNSNYYYITEELLSPNIETLFCNSNKYKNYKKTLNNFVIGTISVNLNNIQMDNFENELNDILDICYEGFLCMYHNLQGLFSDSIPVLFKNGGLYRLDSNIKIDNYLKSNYSKMILNISNFELMYKSNLCEKSKIKKVITEKVNNWNENSNFKIEISNHYESSLDKNILYDSINFYDDNYFKGNNIFFEISKEDFNDNINKNIILIKKND